MPHTGKGPGDAPAAGAPRAGGPAAGRARTAPPGGLLSVLDVRNWRVRTRLVALILVPTVAVVLIGGYQIASAMSAAEEFQRVNQLAKLVQSVSELGHELPRNAT